jgi:phospholipase/lecithinase/hemolysin
MEKNRLICLIMVAISTLFLFLQNSYAVAIDKIVMFGDSLSDTGNIYSLTQKAKKVIPLVPLIPKTPPYFEGRFSNGPVWIENVAKLMQVKMDNYAYGGSWAESAFDSLLIVPFGLDMQVSMHLVSAVTDFHKDRHLYVIWTGGNDYIQGRSDADYATSNTVASIRDQMEWLLFYGAKNIVLVNLPDMGGVPYVVEKGRAFANSVSKLSKMHNVKLAAMVEKERDKYPKANIMLLDVREYYNDIITHPDKYNIKNVKDACYVGGFFLQSALANNAEIQAAKEANISVLTNASLGTAYLTSMAAAAGKDHCDNPDEYLFWDVIHPTRVVHQAFAGLTYNRLYELGFKGQTS